MNVLNINPLGTIAKSRLFPLIPQLMALTVYVLLFAGSVGVENTAKIAPYIEYTNLANQVVWNIWWPVTLVIAVIAGRLWCSVCPLELVNSLSSRIGLKITAPEFFRSGWIITILYAIILFGARRYWGLESVPGTLAIYLAVAFILAVVLGLFLEKRSFCSYVCPLGSIIGLYSYVAGTEWRSDSRSVCDECNTKDCISKNNRYNIIGHSCTSNLYPAKIPDNRECLLCTHCIKACPDQNFRFSLRMPFADFFKKNKIKLLPAEMAILLLIIGFVNHNDWRVLAIFTLIPLFICLLVSWKDHKREMLNAFMVLLIPITAAAHILHAARAVIANLPVYKYNFMDPLGIHTATMLANKTLVIDRSGFGMIRNIYSFMPGLLFSTVFAVSVMIIFRSSLTSQISRIGKCLLVLSVAVYIASFYIRI